MVKVKIGDEMIGMSPYLKEVWDKLKDGKLKQMNEDRVYIVDGQERVGKSVWTLQQAIYLDPSLMDDLSRITFTVEETLEAIRRTRSTDTETKVIVFDESFRGFSSKSALSKDNKLLVSLLMEMGQQNLILFLVTPSFYLMELYASVLRSTALFHIIKRKSDGRRAVRIFNRKKKNFLYTNHGIRKGWNYNVTTKYSIPFPNKYASKKFEREYLAKKQKSIRDFTKSVMKEEKENKFKHQRDVVIRILRKELGISYPEISKRLKESDVQLNKSALATIVRELNEKERKTNKNNNQTI